MSPGRVIKVERRCGYLLFKYFKGGRGRLIKCYLDEIRKDYGGRLRSHVAGQPLEAQPACPACGKALGVVKLIHGLPALKINQGTIRETRI
ncbi:MAG: hypothetical protein JW850_15015 [Thermoflexales bacterium]|nr:hypothetical protein [Thermoflexales bacterium]